jgi:hypothetical protein
MKTNYTCDCCCDCFDDGFEAGRADGTYYESLYDRLKGRNCLPLPLQQKMEELLLAMVKNNLEDFIDKMIFEKGEGWA